MPNRLAPVPNPLGATAQNVWSECPARIRREADGQPLWLPQRFLTTEGACPTATAPATLGESPRIRLPAPRLQPEPDGRSLWLPQRLLTSESACPTAAPATLAESARAWLLAPPLQPEVNGRPLWLPQRLPLRLGETCSHVSPRPERFARHPHRMNSLHRARPWPDCLCSRWQQPGAPKSRA